jgi:hypothetical protein
MGKATDIVFSGLGFPDYCARGVEVEVIPIPAAKQFRRDVNGTLRDVSDPVFRKYQVRINGNDQQFPDLGGVWPGKLVTVTTGVVWAASATGATGAASPAGYGYPGLAVEITGRVTDFSATRDEWAASAGWNITIEEQ